MTTPSQTPASQNIVAKRVATAFILAAIGLVGWQTVFQPASPDWLLTLTKIASISLVVHVVEGVIAAIKAPSVQRPPLSTAIQVFFTGAIGLKELFDLTSPEST